MQQQMLAMFKPLPISTGTVCISWDYIGVCHQMSRYYSIPWILVFYFNIVHSVRPTLAPQGQNYPLAVLVAWMNLDLGIETCFFDGLTVYWKTWLQLLFPLYIWGISGLMIITAKYNIRMSGMMGNNPVSVLATLLAFSPHTLNYCAQAS